jgi:hypothetical protein
MGKKVTGDRRQATGNRQQATARVPLYGIRDTGYRILTTEYTAGGGTDYG